MANNIEKNETEFTERRKKTHTENTRNINGHNTQKNEFRKHFRSFRWKVKLIVYVQAHRQSPMRARRAINFKQR